MQRSHGSIQNQLNSLYNSHAKYFIKKQQKKRKMELDLIHETNCNPFLQMITKQKGNKKSKRIFICTLCEIKLTPSDVFPHLLGKRHGKNMSNYMNGNLLIHKYFKNTNINKMKCIKHNNENIDP
eukprot:90389_1